MPVSLVMIRRGEILVPAAQVDADVLTDIDDNGLVDVILSTRVPRKLARLYWATMSDIGKGTGSTKDGIHGDLMRRTGRVNAVYVDNIGNVLRVTPQSTAEWDGIEWRAYIDEAWPIILSEILPGVHEPTFRRQIEKRVGITFEEARAEP